MSDRKVFLTSFASPVEAEIARTRLEDADIWCTVADAGIVAVNPLLGNAVGGVRLMVFEDDAEQAAEVLAATRDPGELVLDSDEAGEDEYEDEYDDAEDRLSTSLLCPKCGSEDIGFATSFHVYWSLVVFVWIAPMFDPSTPEWDWLRTFQWLGGSTMVFVGFWGTILQLAPLQCANCGERGKRKRFRSGI